MTCRAYISLLSCLMVLLTGCIKEDFDNCFDEEDGFSLSFIYNGNGKTDIFGSKVKSVDIYAFDANGNYVDYWHRSKIDLDNFQGIIPGLTAGEYRFVCWANVTELSLIAHMEAALVGYRLISAPYQLGNLPADFDSLYYGTREVTIPAGLTGTDTVYFSSAHIDVEVYIEGLSTAETAVRAIGDPQGWLEVTRVFASYDFLSRRRERQPRPHHRWKQKPICWYLASACSGSVTIPILPSISTMETE